MTLKNQKGFTLIEALLIALILAVVSFGGYYVWHNQHDKNSKTTNTTNATPATKPTPSPSSASTQKYLTIKEWNIKFQTDDQSSDAYYKFYPKDSDPNQQFMYIDSKDFDALKAYDGTSCNGEYIGVLGRYSKDDPALNAEGVDGVIGERKTVGNYVYAYTTHKQYASPCLFDANVNPIESNTALYDKKVSAYGKMYETIQAE